MANQHFKLERYAEGKYHVMHNGRRVAILEGGAGSWLLTARNNALGYHKTKEKALQYLEQAWPGLFDYALNPADIHVDINSHNAPSRARNPAKRGAPRKGTASPRRKSQITGKKPTVRLVRRRQANSKPGYYPNPAPTMNAPYWIYQNVELFQGRELRETKSFVAACQQKVVADQIVKLLQQYADEGVTFTVEKAY